MTTEALTSSTVIWAAAIIIAVPLLILGAGELQERLRYRDSPFLPAVSILRIWVLPFGAAWLLAATLFDPDDQGFITRLVATAFLVSVAAFALSIARVLVDRLRHRPRGDGRRHVPRLLLALPQLLILLAAGWLLVAGIWDVDLSALAAALGVSTLIVSVALQDTLSGMASGFLLLADHPFQPGDWILANDIEGKVVDTNWRSSRIENRDGDLVVIPNSQLASATIINYDEPTRMHRVEVELQVAYVNPPTLAKKMLLDAARSVDGVLDDPEPRVRVIQIDDPLMGYKVQMWINDFRIEPRVKSDFGSLVWYQSHRQDVPLPSPAYDLYVNDALQAAEASLVGRPEIRRRLRRSELLDQLDEDDVDQLAVAARPARFAAGEVIAAAAAVSPGLHVLWAGRAQIVLRDADDGMRSVAELTEGDLFGVGRTHSEEWVVEVVAITDCEVVIIDSDAAGTVTSRSPDLTDALNQLTATRRRRIGRLIEAGPAAAPAGKASAAAQLEGDDVPGGGEDL